MRLSLSLAVPVVLLSACLPPAVHQSAPAPENAVACARESLERLGYAAEPPSGNSAFRARRTVDSGWVHRVEHRVNVTLETKTTPTLHVRGERVHSKPGPPPLPETPHPTPMIEQRRLESDELLASEVSRVIGECGGSSGSRARLSSPGASR